MPTESCSDVLTYLTPVLSSDAAKFTIQVKLTSWASGYISGMLIAYNDMADQLKDPKLKEKTKNSSNALSALTTENLRSRLAVYCSNHKDAPFADAANDRISPFGRPIEMFRGTCSEGVENAFSSEDAEKIDGVIMLKILKQNFINTSTGYSGEFL